MATTWTIAIDWDRAGELSGDDIVPERAVWVIRVRQSAHPDKIDHAQKMRKSHVPCQP